MVLVEAMFELLAEKGLLTCEEVRERAEKLRDETKPSLRRPQ